MVPIWNFQNSFIIHIIQAQAVKCRPEAADAILSLFLWPFSVPPPEYCQEYSVNYVKLIVAKIH